MRVITLAHGSGREMRIQYPGAIYHVISVRINELTLPSYDSFNTPASNAQWHSLRIQVSVLTIDT